MVPTTAGLQLYELLRGAAPALVDPGTTAVWEMRLDDVVVGKADFRAVIDEIAGEAGRLISVLRQHTGGTVDLGQPAPVGARRGRIKARRKGSANKHATADAAKAKGRRPLRAKPPLQQKKIQKKISGHRQDRSPDPRPPISAGPTSPTPRMVAIAERLAKDKRTALPSGYDKDFDICRRFLDQHMDH